jgi:hypothetical protein
MFFGNNSHQQKIIAHQPGPKDPMTNHKAQKQLRKDVKKGKLAV